MMEYVKYPVQHSRIKITNDILEISFKKGDRDGYRIENIKDKFTVEPIEIDVEKSQDIFETKKGV